MKPPMNLPPNEQWEEMIRQAARGLPYPPTPNAAERVTAQLANEQMRPPQWRNAQWRNAQWRNAQWRNAQWRNAQWRNAQWRPLWVTAMILALLIGLWAVPPVRAAILEFLQIGAVRIWLVEPTPTSAPTADPVSAAPASTPRPTSTPLTSFFNLAGKTTLAEAEAQIGFPIPLPTYPSDLGQPDGVFVQDMNGAVVVLVWLNPEQPPTQPPTQPYAAKYTLHILSNNAFVEKSNPRVVMTTTVNGNPAAWTVGPYMLVYDTGRGQDWQTRYLVTGRVLIWEEDGLTYRLESNLPLEDAIRMAESLQ